MLSDTRKLDGRQISQWASCIKWRNMEIAHHFGVCVDNSRNTYVLCTYFRPGIAIHNGDSTTQQQRMFGTSYGKLKLLTAQRRKCCINDGACQTYMNTYYNTPAAREKDTHTQTQPHIMHSTYIHTVLSNLI